MYFPNQLAKYPFDTIPANCIPKSSTYHNPYSAFRKLGPTGEHIEELSGHPPTVLLNVFDITTGSQEH